MLWVVATPIGDTNEITLRALDVLKSADRIICESTKETSRLLNRLGIKAKAYELLNEHTTSEEIQALLNYCRSENVALVSDCGTPSFSDPGFQIVELCRKHDVPVRSALGASSLMGVISLASERLETFYFRGFLPAENTERLRELKKLKQTADPIVLMDTPYRFKKVLAELCEHFAERKIMLVGNLSQGDLEFFWEGPGAKLKSWNAPVEKAEFMVLIYKAENLTKTRQS